ncbi:MAG: hypothetical protein AAF242_04195 [Bacteroidota bacterium]
MKKFLKWLGIIVLLILVALFIVGWSFHEKKPAANPSAEADALAQQMLSALNKPAWDTTTYIQWTFRAANHYLWDKERNFVEVSWADTKVLLHTKTVTGKAYKAGELLSDKEAEKAIQKAWANFCNDSFWLCAPMKAFDPGTVRSIVEVKDGRKGLMVHYEGGGGVTPEDSYVWLLDEQNIPTSYKMWVSIIPIGGVEATWSDWQKVETGALIAGKRMLFGSTEIPLTNISACMDWTSFERASDPFQEITK